MPRASKKTFGRSWSSLATVLVPQWVLKCSGDLGNPQQPPGVPGLSPPAASTALLVSGAYQLSGGSPQLSLSTHIPPQPALPQEQFLHPSHPQGRDLYKTRAQTPEGAAPSRGQRRLSVGHRVVERLQGSLTTLLVLQGVAKATAEAEPWAPCSQSITGGRLHQLSISHTLLWCSPSPPGRTF